MARRPLAVHASTALCALLLEASLAHAQPRAAAPPAPAQPAPAQPARLAPQPQTPAEARKLSDAFVQVADRVSPSVVQIDVTAREEPDAVMKLFGRGGDSPIARGTGSNIIFTPNNTILTNYHIIKNTFAKFPTSSTGNAASYIFISHLYNFRFYTFCFEYFFHFF